MNWGRILLMGMVSQVALSAPGLAADQISARVKDHQNRVRLVLAWPDGITPTYQLRQVDPKTIEITTQAGDTLAPFAVTSAFPEIADLRAISNPGEALKIWISLASGGFDRAVVAGNRVILDVDQQPKLRAASAAPVVPVQPSPAAPVAPSVASAPAHVPDPSSPPVITLSSAAPFGMAAFLYNQKLWLVVDQPDFVIMPQLAVKDSRAFKPFVRTNLPEATLFTLDLPPGYTTLRGEGGDVHWRVVLSAPNKDVPAIPAKRDGSDEDRALLWPLANVTKLITITDPDTDQRIQVATVQKSDQYAGAPARYRELEQVHTGLGLAILPRADDVVLKTTDRGVIATRPGGLSLLDSAKIKAPATPLDPKPAGMPPPPNVDESEIGAVPAPLTPAAAPDETGTLPLYRFDRWALGGADALMGNESALMADLADKGVEDRAGGYMNIGKMYLSNGRGGEALGFFRLAAEITPALLTTPDFLALRGAAYALNRQYDLAYEDLRVSDLDAHPDIHAWRAEVLANLQDWQQAAEKLGTDLSWVAQYPNVISDPMMLTFAEVSLRAGDNARAQKILNNIAPNAGEGRLAARDYLLGEAARQMGNKDEARKLWTKLSKSNDDKYRVRARLALTVLDYDEGKITPQEAIDHLESLRYAWRGDEVEVAINARLGEIYLDHAQYLRGLNVLRDAASLAPETEAGRRITTIMNDAFQGVFLGEGASKIDPLDAITVFEKFPELMPVGQVAHDITLKLVDRLLQVDLLSRAQKVLTDMIDHKLQGPAQVQAGLRLAAVYLMDQKPQPALAVLNKTDVLMATQKTDEGSNDAVFRESALLRARAQFLAGQVDAAFATLQILSDDADVLRMRADLAWQTGRWPAAAAALSDLLALDPVAEDKPPSEAQADLIRNLAVATNLAGDRAALADLRARYSRAMMQTQRAKEFDVITRERQAATLADRDTLNKLVAEVDLFGNFLDSYKAMDKPVAPKPPVGDTPSTPVPPTPR